MRIMLLLAPAMLIIVVLFFGGLAAGLMRSFNYMPVIGLTRPNLEAYAAVFTSREFYLSFLLTFHIAFTSTVISSVLAIGAALLLRRSFIGKSVINFLFQLNLTVPHIVGAIGILYLFSQSGSFARLGYHWGLIAKPGDFPALVFDPYAIGIILQYVWKEIPFIGVIVLCPAMRSRKMHSTSSNWNRLRCSTTSASISGYSSGKLWLKTFNASRFTATNPDVGSCTALPRIGRKTIRKSIIPKPRGTLEYSPPPSE